MRISFVKALFGAALLFLGLSAAAPMDSCQAQSDCLGVTFGECQAGMREVCLQWNPSAQCVKAGSTDGFVSTVSHSCAGIGGSKDIDNDGSEDWHQNSPICMTVVGGEDAVFGVKDGRGCSMAGVYDIQGQQEATCNGPENVCDGQNTKECKWTIKTEPCEVTPTPQCPSDLTCEVKIPCSQDHDGMDCECHKYVYVRE